MPSLLCGLEHTISIREQRHYPDERTNCEKVTNIPEVAETAWCVKTAGAKSEDTV